jgi:hypothetical protein
MAALPPSVNSQEFTVLSIARQGHIENTLQNVLGLVFRL